MTTIDDAILLMWTRQLDSRDKKRRHLAGQELCRLLGVDAAMGQMQEAPPAWPLTELVLVGGGRTEAGLYVTCAVRTTLGGVLEERMKVSVKPRGGVAREDVEWAASHGREMLRRRIEGMVVVGGGT